MITVAAEFCLQLLLLMGVGIYAGRRSAPEFRKGMSWFMVNILVPCMVVSVMIDKYTPGDMSSSVSLMWTCVAVLSIGAVVGILVRLLVRGSSWARDVVLPCIIFMNANFIGYPVIQAVCGDAALVQANFFMIPFRVFFYTVIPLCYQANSERKMNAADIVRQLGTALLSPSIIATLVGLVIVSARVHVPSPVLSVMRSLGDAAMPIGMVACGMFISETRMKDAIKEKACWITVLARNMLVPALVLLFMLAIGADKTLLTLGVIFASLPSPGLAAPFAKQYGKDAGLAAQIIFLSTLAAAVTIPFWTVVIEKASVLI